MSKNKKNKLIKRIFMFLDESGLTQKEFAARCGINVNTVTRWKNGSVEIAEDSLAKVAEALGVSLEKLKGEPERLTQEQSEVIQDSLAIATLAHKIAQEALENPVFARRLAGNINKLRATVEQSVQGLESSDK